MYTLISTLYKATETGDKLDQFAAVAGMTANEFKQAWAEDAVGAMNAFIQGLNDTERNGKSAIVILDELGITNVRQTKAILGLASAGDLLSNTIDQANNAWEENTALADKAGIMYGTTEAKLTMMQNAANNVKVAVGDALNGALANLAAAVTPVLQGIATFIEQNPAIVQALTTVVGIVGAVTGGIVALSAALKVAGIAAGVIGTIMSGGVLPAVLAATGVIAGLAGGAVYLNSVLGDTQMSFEEMDESFDQTMSDIKKQNHIIELCEEYRQLQSEIDNANRHIDGLETATSVGVKLTPEIEESGKLSADDFVSPLEVQLTPEQADYLASTDFLDKATGVTVKLSPEAADYLNSKGFLVGEDDTVQLTPDVADTLEAAGFLEGSTVLLDGDAQANLMGEDFFVDGTEVQITAEAAGELAAAKLLDGDTVTLYGKADGPALTPNDFVEGTTTITLTPSVADKLREADVLDSTKVTLTPECIDRLQQQGLIESDTVTLSANVAEKLVAQNLITGDEVVIKGIEDEGNLIPIENFVNGTTVTITPEMGDVTAIENKLSGIKSQIESVETQLSSANSTLTSMESAYEELHNKFTATTDKTEKVGLAKQLVDLGGLIDLQKGKVEDLQGAYDSLTIEYSETESALQTLTGKQERLAAVKGELVAESGGLISATEAETDAFNKQVDALEAIARMKQEDARKTAYDNITAQAGKYAQAIKDADVYQEQLNEATAKHEWFVEKSKLGAEGLKEELNTAYDALADLRDSKGMDFDWNSSEVQAYVSEIEDLVFLMTGQHYDFAGFANLEMGIGSIEGSFNGIESAIEAARQNVVGYGEAVEAADGTQQTFLDNLVSGVMDGGMSLEYLEGLLNEQFKNVEGGAEIVAEAMDYVRKHVEDAANSTDGMGDGFDEAADSALDFQNAIAPIAEEMEKLGKAYTDAYNSALKSIEGQFDLFEKAGKIKINPELDIGDMTGNLMSQVKYIEQYTQMLQDAAAMGVNTDLLASLSDGSEESAAALAEITSSSQAEIDQLNAAYESAEAARKAFASTSADITSEFSSKMGELEKKMSETIANMEMSSEAAANARTTLQAMATAADGMLDTVSAAYGRVAAAAQAQLNKIHAPSISVAGGLSYTKAAIGADPTHAGVYMVGEEGPELVMMSGGERIFTADETEAILRRTNLDAAMAAPAALSSPSGNETNIVFAPVYNISGGSNTEQIRTMIEEHDEGMRSRLEDILKEIEVDERRRAFA